MKIKKSGEPKKLKGGTPHGMTSGKRGLLYNRRFYLEVARGFKDE